ncbi:MAG: hypothetical protein A2Y53_07865 [Chloroflexi bacterium RBG_16_47_49]|nr:MAG: hypothetical protein A2Y53_07865 [Chloroflexi bacterium RBG_16_47_49]
MEEDIHHYEKQIILLRKQLADLEVKRSQYQSNVPSEIWQVLADVSYRLEQAEQKVKRFNQEIIGDLNYARAQIIAFLEEFMHLQEQIRHIEDQFMVNIVRPGYHLKKAVRQREYLEGEYHRMRKKILRAGYGDLLELEQEIRRVISAGKAEEEAQSYEEYEEQIQEENPSPAYQWMDVDDLLDIISKEELLKEFKRVVLPATHPDTSTTPVDVFITVNEVYKKEDLLLMEAYIIEYRGEITTGEGADPLEDLDRASELLKRYQRVTVWMERRVARVKEEISTQELDHPEKVQDNMQIQRQEILNRIQHESEQILYWREQIEGLVKVLQAQDVGSKEET